LTPRPPSILRIRDDSRDGVCTLALEGELDYGVIGQLEAAWADACASGASSIVLDLSDLEFADCSAVRLLVALAARAEGDGARLALRRGPARVQRVFELTGTADTLPFEAE
jgi:anti-sigma B factor antagonist